MGNSWILGILWIEIWEAKYVGIGWGFQPQWRTWRTGSNGNILERLRSNGWKELDDSGTMNTIVSKPWEIRFKSQLEIYLIISDRTETNGPTNLSHNLPAYLLRLGFWFQNLYLHRLYQPILHHFQYSILVDHLSSFLPTFTLWLGRSDGICINTCPSGAFSLSSSSYIRPG